LSPSKQRRNQRMKAAAADLGMTLEQWRAWRIIESAERPRRDRARWEWRRNIDRRERDARLRTGRGTVLDGLGVYTEAYADALREAMTRHILYGSAS
jgi:hypothetical protein